MRLAFIPALIVLAGCVAPDEPAAPRYIRPAAAPSASATPNAQFELAPIPDRHIGRPTGDSIIHTQ